MKEEKIFFKNKTQKLVGVVHLPNNKNPPAVVICHGLSTNKDVPNRVELAKKICENGFAVLRFDFRCHGESDGRPEELTYSGAAKDLESAIDFLETIDINREKIGVIGSSFGGKAALIAAASDRRIKALSVWVTPHIFSQKEKEEMKKVIDERGYYPYKKDFNLSRIFLEDEENIDMFQIAKKIKIPTLAILADKDEIIDLKMAIKFYDAIKAEKEFIVFKNVNHWIMDNLKYKKQSMNLTINWLKKWLK